MKHQFKIMIVTLAVVAFAAMDAMARGLDPLFDEFKNVENVEYVKVPRLLMMLGKASGTMNGVPLAGNIKEVEVLDLSGCDSDVRDRFINRSAGLGAGLEELMRATSDGDQLKMWIDSDGDKIKRVYILALSEDSDDNCALIALKGNFSRDDIARMINKSGDGNND